MKTAKAYDIYLQIGGTFGREDITTRIALVLDGNRLAEAVDKFKYITGLDCIEMLSDENYQCLIDILQSHEQAQMLDATEHYYTR